MKRRLFLKSSAIAMFGAGSAPAWLSRALYAADATSPRKKVLIAVFQRGAVDGLNMVIPFGEKRYYELRPNIAIPSSAVVDLDGFFGLHPSMSPLKPIWTSGQMAVVNASGSPNPTRSHFDAQDYMESGTPGQKSTADGWLNRSLTAVEGRKSPVRAVGLGTSLPRALRGRNEAVAIGSVGEFRVRDPKGAETFESMYATTVDRVLKGTARETFDAVRMMESIQKATYTPAAGVKYPTSNFGRSMQEIAKLIKSDVGLEVAFTDIGGWDTHVNEVAAQPTTGRLATLLADFSGGLAAFAQDMGDRMADIVVVTMSEFGRTAKENGNRGTDHGHANAMLVIGGGVRGGRMYGEWPGLEHEQLYEGRDLAVTTDFRDVLGELVTGHLGNREITRVFPGYSRFQKRGVLG